MDVTAALTEVGGFGTFQKLLCFGYIPVCQLYVVFAYWTQVFLFLVPDHKCKPSPFNPLYTEENASKIGSKILHKCHYAVDAAEGNQSQIVSCSDGWEYDFSLLFPNIATQHDWVCKESWRPYSIHAAFWAGATISFLLCGFVSDIYGRKKTLYFVLLIVLLGNGATVFVSGYALVAAVRFLAGAGIMNSIGITFMIVMEYVSTERRTIVAVTLNSSFCLMSTVYPWIASYIGDWQWLAIVVTLCNVILIVATWWVPESVTWLVAVGRLEDAQEMIRYVARINGRHLRDDFFEEVSTPLNDGSDKKPAEPTKMTSSADLVRDPSMRRRTLCIVYIWLVICMYYHGKSLQIGKLGTNILVTYSIGNLVELPAIIFCIFALDKLGRRWPNVLFLMLSGISGIVFTFVPADCTWTIFILAMLVFLGLGGSYDISLQFMTEIFPTVLRGRGVMLTRMFGVLGGVLGSQVAYLGEYESYLPLMVLGSLTIFGCIAVLFLPETAGFPLAQSIQDSKDAEKDQDMCFCPCTQSYRRRNSSASEPTVC